MSPPTNAELNAKREESCIAITHEKKYYGVGQTWIKRSLRPWEWQKRNGYMPIPLFNLEHDGAAYLITEYVEGVGTNELDVEKQEVVAKELRTHMETLSKLTSNVWGGPSGLVLPPYRIMRHSNGRPWEMKPRETQDLVFCHNDLSANNVIVDPNTLKITAIMTGNTQAFIHQNLSLHFSKDQVHLLHWMGKLMIRNR
ncbi:hypothetical protein MAC_04445 [Metarhizium acridum CQMa 102]|uniref:Aminoglycoside phosphotransferase domain-containing protein n=1 Tax=Metarhizium acridum (strain CQMa 102) TaxID=655827 RepID=E9E3J7_METAQ|nr:uncharacterized protein MAC_04445 [Metarhizium acridum CQMa 102]EFY89590.1 hypothetical protein MAC_04445 [Metarhizium acridum CQMa 102]